MSIGQPTRTGWSRLRACWELEPVIAEAAMSESQDRTVATEISEFDWDMLLILMKDKAVVPIVGKELLRMEIDGEQTRFDRYLATRLAEELGIDRQEELSESYDLDEVACLHLGRARVRELEKKRIYGKIKAISRERVYPVTDALDKLARITDFELFVSTTFDTLLPRALETNRGPEQTECLSYDMNRGTDDLPGSGGDSIVYQIFGCQDSDYAVTDEDHLEILHRLQDPGRRPERLFDELATKNLLFIGCGFPDGLARFLVRTLANQRLESAACAYSFADSEAARNARFALFLQNCSTTEVYRSGDSGEFVDRLYAKWSKEREEWSAKNKLRREETEPGPERVTKVVERPEKGSIFLSYKREDQAAVGKLKASLERSGLKIWMDQSDIGAGANWQSEIRENIKSCTLFLPCLSRRALVPEGVLHAEWDLALERRKAIAGVIPFIIPIRLDDTDERARLIPEGFWENQALKCPGGEIDGEGIRQVKETMRKAMSLRAGRSAPT